MKRYAMETSVGIFVVFGLLCIGYLTLKLGDISLPGNNTYRLFARFTSVSGLRTGSPVNILGIGVGRVEKLTMDQAEQRAVVEISVRKDIRIYDDALASIRTEGLIGDRYPNIDPGGSGEVLPAGGTIVETQPAVEISDLIGRYAFGEIRQENGKETADEK